MKSEMRLVLKKDGTIICFFNKEAEAITGLVCLLGVGHKLDCTLSNTHQKQRNMIIKVTYLLMIKQNSPTISWVKTQLLQHFIWVCYHMRQLAILNDQ
jgi:hypothetical protein